MFCLTLESPSPFGNDQKWGDDWCDFHGICDMVLVSSPEFGHGLGLDIHVRTKPRHQCSCIEAAAVKIGEDVLEVGSWGQCWLNGVENVELPTRMGGKYVLDLVQDNKKNHKFVISIGGLQMEAIVIKVFKDLVNVSIENATMATFETSSGLLGSFPEGDMLARDGATILEDESLFGQEWQVTGNDPQLFLTANPHQPVASVCVAPVVSDSRRFGEGIAKTCVSLM